MLVKTTGLVLRSIKYGESSLIFDLYTREYGVASFVVGGVRKTRARTPASVFQLMNWIEVVAYYKDNNSLSRVKEARAVLNYQDLPFSLQKRGVGLFITELVQKTVKERESNSQLYHFLANTYQFLDQTEESPSNIHIIFLLQLSVFLGFVPNGKRSASTPHFNLLTGSFEDVHHPIYSTSEKVSEQLSLCLAHKIENAHVITMSRLERRSLIQDLITYYKLHLEKLPDIQTHKILAEVLDC